MSVFKKFIASLGIILVMLSLGLAIRAFYPTNALGNNTNIATDVLFTTAFINTEGKPQNLKQYQGKIIVLNFWATWCPPCREEMPELTQLHQEYQHKNVAVLGLALDELNLVQEFLQTSPVSYPIFVADSPETDLSGPLGNDKGVLPYTVIINADGQVVNTYFGRISKSLIETAIKPLLSE
ncbi:MAG: redoxin family protein [Methylotenera sp.]|nr:redoxin family protein [Methylotenera sp.]MDO9234125.1 redoxin family protein [Methylotenera sp.]MDO9234244.1 redoxin family protein [Methylotenera sp.]MDO9389401.1 redoxin family protein [Methylotenera sp.]MDP2103267.1 redoxin family protein [Methylotenera sp.]